MNLSLQDISTVVMTFANVAVFINQSSNIKNNNIFNYKRKKFNEAILAVDNAVEKTYNYISNNNIQNTNHDLIEVWRGIEEKLEQVEGLETLKNIAIEKKLYWFNPTHYKENHSSELDKIKLLEIRKQLNKLRIK